MFRLTRFKAEAFEQLFGLLCCQPLEQGGAPAGARFMAVGRPVGPSWSWVARWPGCMPPRYLGTAAAPGFLSPGKSRSTLHDQHCRPTLAEPQFARLRKRSPGIYGRARAGNCHAQELGCAAGSLRAAPRPLVTACVAAILIMAKTLGEQAVSAPSSH